MIRLECVLCRNMEQIKQGEPCVNDWQEVYITGGEDTAIRYICSDSCLIKVVRLAENISPIIAVDVVDLPEID